MEARVYFQAATPDELLRTLSVVEVPLGFFSVKVTYTLPIGVAPATVAVMVTGDSRL